nr:hypothetical protein [Micromonospora sp. DSM 115978]
MAQEDRDNRRPGRWRPINERRIGGRHDRPGPVPDTIPTDVQAETLRTMLLRHQPIDDATCCCGQPLGEDTGLCWYGRQAQKRLYEVILDQKAAEDPE